MSTYRILDRGLLDPAPFNPRKVFDQEALAELAGSLQAHGVLEPLVVRPKGERFEIVAGERRYRAAGVAGLVELPCTVRELDDKAAMVALLENLQREDLDPMEEAEAFRQLVQSGVYTVEGLANRLHKSTRHVYQRMSLCKLCPELVQLVGQKRLQASAAELLAKEQPHRQQELCVALGLLKNASAEEKLEGLGLLTVEGKKELSVRDIKARLKKYQDAENERVAGIQKERRKHEKQWAKEEEQRKADQEARQKLAEKWWKEMLAKLEETPLEQVIRLLALHVIYGEYYEDPQDKKKQVQWAKKGKLFDVVAYLLVGDSDISPFSVKQLLEALPDFCPPSPWAEKEEGK